MKHDRTDYMNWIIASLVLFISSVILYLSVRKSQLMKVSNAFNKGETVTGEFMSNNTLKVTDYAVT